MIKRHLIAAALFCSSFLVKAQPDTSAQIKVNQTEVSILYNQYIQDGTHSAVTGGQGTEQLIVYGPSLKYKRTFGKNSINFQAGSDIISSASTDNIDFVDSSASELDARTYTDIQYTRTFEKQKLSINAGLGFSIESDYFSSSKTLGIEKLSKNEMQTYSAQLQIFNDDLRWGRLDEDYYRPVMLIYPEELRNQDWYNIHHRNSYHLKLGFTQIVDQRNILGFFTQLSFQEGILATPFHRAYFTDGSVAVETLPRKRYRAALTTKWNRFINGNIILKNTLNGYADNFGVLGLALENETAIKFHPRWTISPGFRFYMQKKSKYFAPFQQHQLDATYFTSDFDLSSFRSYKTGLTAKYIPFHKFGKRFVLKTISLNYQFYYRSDGMTAHLFSFFIDFDFLHRKKKRK